MPTAGCWLANLMNMWAASHPGWPQKGLIGPPPGNFPEISRKFPGNFPGIFPEISRKCPGIVLDFHNVSWGLLGFPSFCQFFIVKLRNFLLTLFGATRGAKLRIPHQFPSNFREMSAKIPGIFQDISGRFPGHF